MVQVPGTNPELAYLCPAARETPINFPPSHVSTVIGPHKHDLFFRVSFLDPQHKCIIFERSGRRRLQRPSQRVGFMYRIVWGMKRTPRLIWPLKLRWSP